jgi:hypothetical protein
VLVSIEQRTVFYLFDKEIECVVELRPLLAGLREDRPVSRVSLGHQIISSFLWEDVLFFTDLHSVWMYFPAALGKEHLKGLHRLEHCRYEPAGNLLSSKIKPAGGCFIVGLIDRKLLLVNNELEIIPLEIKEPLFAFYLLLKNNEKELALDMVKSADYRLQETYARIALV